MAAKKKKGAHPNLSAEKVRATALRLIGRELRGAEQEEDDDKTPAQGFVAEAAVMIKVHARSFQTGFQL